MINDFKEIKNEKDREIYVQCRQILDNWFLAEQRGHETKEHLLNECWNKQLEVIKQGLYEVINEQGMTYEHSLAAISNTESELMIMFQYAIIIHLVSSEMGPKQ